MKFVARFLLTALLPILLEACASTMPAPLLRSEVEIFRVGELEIRLYQDQERMARELPQSLALFDALRVGNKRLRVLGYYDEPNRRIYSINDARVLLHEIKHYLEPHWRHEVAGDYLEAMQPAVQSACVDCTATVE
ncbi:MAG TPA: hypothetical protein VNN13_09865 [Methylomirabilota bacterium]|nr:hypothetical protein [Methylomirabilota bacterium]